MHVHVMYMSCADHNCIVPLKQQMNSRSVNYCMHVLITHSKPI